GAGAEDPPFVVQIVKAVALELQLFQRRSFLETTPAPLAGAHEQIQPLLNIADFVGGRLVLMAHGDGFLRANIRAASAIGATPPKILQDANLLADIKNEDFARRTIVRAARAADALLGIEDGPAPEVLRHRPRLRRIRQGHAAGLEADHRFFQFACNGHEFVSIRIRNPPAPERRTPPPAIQRSNEWPGQSGSAHASRRRPSPPARAPALWPKTATSP